MRLIAWVFPCISRTPVTRAQRPQAARNPAERRRMSSVNLPDRGVVIRAATRPHDSHQQLFSNVYDQCFGMLTAGWLCFASNWENRSNVFCRATAWRHSILLTQHLESPMCRPSSACVKRTFRRNCLKRREMTVFCSGLAVLVPMPDCGLDAEQLQRIYGELKN
jgi:hypothetical protein